MAEIMMIVLISTTKEAYPYQSSMYTMFATAVLANMARAIFTASARL